MRTGTNANGLRVHSHFPFSHSTLSKGTWIVASILILMLSQSCGGGGSNTPATLKSIAITSAESSIELGTAAEQFTATGIYSDGTSKDVTAIVKWISTNPVVATVDISGTVSSKAVGNTSIQASLQSITGQIAVVITPPGHFLMKNAGLYTQFDDRGWASGYYSGDILHRWNSVDPVVGTLVSQEISNQLDAIHMMGVNTITFELRSSDPTYTGNFAPPDCNEGPVLGLLFPQPSTTDLTNLVLLLDMLQSKHMKMWLRLVNVHMEQQPPTNSQMWLGAILAAVGQHPALDAIMFEGTTYTIVLSDSHGNPITVCGVPAEPPLWLGPSSTGAVYVQWAIGYAMSLGIPASKLSAEAIVGNYFMDSQSPAGPSATDGHQWAPIQVEKIIFDNLNIPVNQRTYALSLYEHTKCAFGGSGCVDIDPYDWADQTFASVTNIVGAGPRIILTEMGNSEPVNPATWNTPHSLESLIFLIHKYGVDGGAFWQWVNLQNSDDANPALGTPVKVRGVAYNYNPVRKEVIDMGGFHLPLVPNGSYENADVNNMPIDWIVAGNGTATQYLLSQEAGEPEVPSRGTHSLRIVTGSGLADAITASSVMIPVQPGITYTSTSNCRFSWTGDPNPSGPAATRPQVFINVLYFKADGTASSVRVQDSFAYFQENSTSGFDTFPVQYTTPSDAAFVEIEFGAARNNLPTPITFDVDNVR